MRLRLRPLLVALSFLSAVALGGIALSTSSRLMRGGVEGVTLVGAAFALGAAVAALAFTRARRPGVLWAGGLMGAFLLALPVTSLGQAPPLVIAALTLVLGSCAAASVIGAAASLAGGPDLPGQDLAQVLGVSAIGAAVGVGLPQLGPVASVGFDGLARGFGGLGLLVGAAVLLVVRVGAEAREDEALSSSPPRLVGLGFVLASMGVLGQAVVVAAAGAAPTTRPLAVAALLFTMGLALAWVAARRGVDADLGERRTTATLGVLFGVLGLLAPRLPGAFVIAEAVVRPNAASWLVELVVRTALLAVALGPLALMAGQALGCSARHGVRTASNAGRWLAGLASGAALGFWLSSAALSARALEPWWVATACGGIAVAAWRWRPFLYAAVPMLALAYWGRGWSTELITIGPATSWRRALPTPEALASRGALDFAALDATGTVTLHREATREVARSGGHVELVTGRAGERVLLGVHAALLSSPGQVRSALVLGVAPGVLEALAAHGVTRVDVVAPAPLLEVGLRLGVPLQQATLHARELRPFLDEATDQWDLIVIAPSRPGTLVTQGLFTLEFWQAARRRLAAGGQVVQQLDLGESNTSLTRTALRTLRLVFPSGTTWGGVGQISAVMSEVPPVLAPERLEGRMQPPAVAAALKPLELGAPLALLAWQVHSPEGQVRFAGAGPASTDRQPLLELGVPVAAFIDELVDLGDERRLPGPTGLVLSRLAQERPLTAAELEGVHRALARHFAAWEPLVRSSAEQWAALDPSDEAVAAVSRSALAQHDVATAIALLAPRLRTQAPAPELVALALEALTAQLQRESAVFRLVDTEGLRALGRDALTRHPQHEGLRAALEKLEATR